MAAPFDLIEEAKRLIRFNTVTGGSNADCAVHVGSLLRKIGCRVSYQESRAEGVLFLNVVGWIGQGKDPLLLATHLDTVDPGDPRLWSKSGRDPWRLVKKGNTLYGLGVADTKLDLLCKVLAVARVGGKNLKRPVILLGTFGEESGLRGAARFCQGEIPKPQMALVGEPSELSLVTRHKGLAVIEISFLSRGLHRPSQTEWVYEVTFRGKAAHSSTPALGVNAIEESLGFFQGIVKRFSKVRLLSWSGGTAHNIIPAGATLRFSLGDHPKAGFRSSAKQQVKVDRLSPGWYSTLPWEEMLWSVQTVRELMRPFERLRDRTFEPPALTWNFTSLRETKQGWAITWDARALPGQPIVRTVKALERKLWKRFGHPGPTWQFRLERENPALDLRRDALVVKLAAAALRAARLPVRIAAKAGCSEAGLYSRVGIPSVVIGPGRSTGNIHQPNESIAIGQLKAAVRFYESFLRKVCL